MVTRPLGNSQLCGRQKAPRAAKRAPRQYPEPCDAESQREVALPTGAFGGAAQQAGLSLSSGESFFGHEERTPGQQQKPSLTQPMGEHKGRDSGSRHLKTPCKSGPSSLEESASFSQLLVQKAVCYSGQSRSKFTSFQVQVHCQGVACFQTALAGVSQFALDWFRWSRVDARGR